MKNIQYLGTTSFIIVDSRIQNVKFLASQIDTVQLLFLEKNSLMDDINEIDELKKLSDSYDLNYVIHLPTDFDFNNDITTIKLFFSELQPLKPSHFILHPEDADIFYDKLEELQKVYPICVENIDDISLFQKIYEIGCNICFDVGHALMHDKDIKDFIKKYGERIMVYHLHGVVNNTDHNSLRFLDEKLLCYLLDFGLEKNIINIIEVFKIHDYLDSKECLKEVFKKYGYSYHRWY
ncbi:MAG: hypothetical protein N3C60_09455 [Calditerrivibrio sp.]|nr:hypothetical protein [Calditerrivibrio sp.]